MGLTFHTSAFYVNGPWNYTPFHPRDEDLFTAIGNSYAGSTGYNVVFGWDWYQISGDVNDWSLGTAGTFDWTIEIASDTDLNWQAAEPGLLDYFSWALKGIKGRVTDADTGNYLNALITVEPEGEPVFSSALSGTYHRILLPGTYEVTAWASGYKPKTVSGVKVSEGSAVTLNFKLQKQDSLRAAIKIDSMITGRDITNSYFENYGYDNTTLPSDSLGMRDGWYYSLGLNGEITLDMGGETPVYNNNSDELIVVSGTGSNDPADVFAAQNSDGPFVKVASGTGDIRVDPGQSNLEWIRFIKIADAGNSVFGEHDGGYDLDAVEVININDTQRPADSDSATSILPRVIGGCTHTPVTRDATLFNILL
jgi:hypothetical protein